MKRAQSRVHSIDWVNGFKFAFIGGIYGVSLLVAGIFAAGSGHGTYLPFIIFGLPLSLLDQYLVLHAVLAVWPVVGFVLGSFRRALWPTVVLLIHAFAVVAVLCCGSPFDSAEEQWADFQRAYGQIGASIRAGFLVYLVGQVAAWGLVLRRWFATNGAP